MSSSIAKDNGDGLTDQPQQQHEDGTNDAYDDVNPSPTKKPRLGSPPLIIIEYCPNTVCNLLLENKANELKEALEKGITDIKVQINPDLPFRSSEGWFQVRTEYGRILRDYPNLRQPFQEVGELEVSQVVSELQALIN